MSMDEHPLHDWLTGTPKAPHRQQIVMQSPDLRSRVLSGKLISPGFRLYRPWAPDGRPRSTPTRTAEFDGDFLAADEIMVLTGGYRSTLIHYGSAEFACLDLGTVLRIFDGDDFSAYLRDADQAWTDGHFADHVTHPNVIISDMAGLGAAFGRAGPDDRLFVFEDGSISTSPTGRVIGDIDDTLADVRSRWSRLNDLDPFPDAICLDAVVPGSDRVDALRERSWIRRYVTAVDVIRAARRADLMPSMASGFGPRITPGLPRPVVPDEVGAPFLLQVGHELRAYDPVGPGSIDLSPDAAAVLEALVGSTSIKEARRRCAAIVLIPPSRINVLVLELLQRLSLAHIAVSWCRRTRRALLSLR